MKSLIEGVLLAGFAFGSAAAQNPPATDGRANPSDRPGASKDSNEAIRTRDDEIATQPAKGANSFTEAEAKHRIESKGFQNVSNLHKDDDGVWRAVAQRDGRQVGVWLDYKGNVGIG